MHIRLTEQEFRCLQEAIINEAPNHLILKKGLTQKNGELDVTEEEATELREICAEYLLKVGFDQKYTANKTGLLLETLVDKLYVP